MTTDRKVVDDGFDEAAVLKAFTLERAQALGKVADNYYQGMSFDPDLSPTHATNQEAAKKHGWTYDPHAKAYRDHDGSLVADEFGQPL